MSLKERINKLESRPYLRSKSAEEMTDAELARVITGDPDAKTSDLTDDDL